MQYPFVACVTFLSSNLTAYSFICIHPLVTIPFSIVTEPPLGAVPDTAISYVFSLSDIVPLLFIVYSPFNTKSAPSASFEA